MTTVEHIIIDHIARLNVLDTPAVTMNYFIVTAGVSRLLYDIPGQESQRNIMNHAVLKTDVTGTPLIHTPVVYWQ